MLRCFIAFALTILTTFASNADTISITGIFVDSTEAPWDPTINPTTPYGNGSGFAPVAIEGFDFQTGSTFSFSNVTGQTSAYFGIPPYAPSTGYYE
jgi:hypothetical protein